MADTQSLDEPFLILISGTHVTGKETLAIRVAQTLGCPWYNGGMSHNSATFGARAQARRGHDYDQVYGRIWTAKLQRLTPSFEHRSPSRAVAGVEVNQTSDPKIIVESWQSLCRGVVTCYAMRRPARDAIRRAMRDQGINTVFAIMQISPQTLSGRTLGAEEPDLASRIMAGKAADIEMPDEDEKGDLFLLDEWVGVDDLVAQTVQGVEAIVSRRGACTK